MKRQEIIDLVTNCWGGNFHPFCGQNSTSDLTTLDGVIRQMDSAVTQHSSVFYLDMNFSACTVSKGMK